MPLGTVAIESCDYHSLTKTYDNMIITIIFWDFIMLFTYAEELTAALVIPFLTGPRLSGSCIMKEIA